MERGTSLYLDLARFGTALVAYPGQFRADTKIGYARFWTDLPLAACAVRSEAGSSRPIIGTECAVNFVAAAPPSPIFPDRRSFPVGQVSTTWRKVLC
jgi:hypothetical protein